MVIPGYNELVYKYIKYISKEVIKYINLLQTNFDRKLYVRAGRFEWKMQP